MDCSINIDPYLKNFIKEMGYPFFSLILDITILAEAPIKVPFPPRHAPRARAHHRGCATFMLMRAGSASPILLEKYSTKCLTIGIITITKGMLSRTEEKTAEPQRISIHTIKRFLPAICSTPSPIQDLTPFTSSAEIIMN
ncbi:MAG: hypothetical protein WBD17_04305, partial [Candidatus Omnitrophota bacterium]